MSDENTTEVTAEATAEATTSKKTKEVRTEEALYCANKANSEGTVHAQIQRYVFANPGTTRSAVVSALAGTIDTKNAVASEKYVSSYIAGGLRRGYLTHVADEVAAEFPVKERKTERKSEKVATGQVTKQGRVLIEALEGVVNGAEAARTTVVSSETLQNALGNKPLSHAARTLAKLEKDGFITVTRNEENAVEGVALTEKEVPAAPVAAEAPVAEETTAV